MDADMLWTAALTAGLGLIGWVLKSAAGSESHASWNELLKMLKSVGRVGGLAPPDIGLRVSVPVTSLQFSGKSKLIAHYTSINTVPKVITNSAPFSIEANLKPSFSLIGTIN